MKTTRVDLSICIPVFNEEEAIGDTLIALKAAFPEAEIIVVDDASTDRTAELARAVDGITFVANERNRGYGASLKTAMREAHGDAIAWYDGDGQHQPDDLARVVAPVIAGEKDAVIGVRGKDSDARLERQGGKWLLKAGAEIIVRARIPDLNSGMRCFRADVIKKYLHLLPDGFSASSTTTLLMMKRGYRLGHEPITAKARAGKSSVRIFRDGWRTIQVLVRMLILFEAFGFFTFLSVLQIVPAMIYGVWISFTNRLGFPILASTVIISGLLTFFMGLLCDQITALRKEKFED